MKLNLNENVSRWIRPEIRALSAYHVPNAAGLVKLDAMENPYVWPDKLIEEWLDGLRRTPINRYPDPSPEPLKRQLREIMAVPSGMEILLGNGSDELIQLVLMGLSLAGRCVVAPEPTFVMYRQISAALGLNYKSVPLRKDDFALDGEAMLHAVAKHEPAAVFLAYPNNPTGNLFDDDVICRVLEAAPGLVVVDEAYAPFADATFMQRLQDYPNLLIMRTLSKLGLAGLRLGMLVGRREWLTELDKIRLPYNVNVLTQASVAFAAKHYDVLRAQAADIVRDRSSLLADLTGLDGVKAWPSHANFILFRVQPGTAGVVADGLREAGILIKSFPGSGPPLEDCLRVTIGTPEENRAFIGALTTLL